MNVASLEEFRGSFAQRSMQQKCSGSESIVIDQKQKKCANRSFHCLPFSVQTPDTNARYRHFRICTLLGLPSIRHRLDAQAPEDRFPVPSRSQFRHRRRRQIGPNTLCFGKRRPTYDFQC